MDVDDRITYLLPNDDQYIPKCEEYINYIKEHTTKVFTAYEKYFKDRIKNIIYNINADYVPMAPTYEKMLEEAIRRHDESKYSDEEFDAYRLKYYPTDKENDLIAIDKEKMDLVDEMFEDAWHHHYIMNPHHPKFFIWNEKSDSSPTGWEVLDNPKNESPSMPIVYIMEMLCDWAAMCKGKDDFNYINWWLSSDSDSEHKVMNGETKEIVKKITAIILPNEFELVKDNPRWFI